ncbi:MAG TPA: glycoside hydrolase family protein [Rickettsia endosymbiont of Degeeriella rufa]|nr:glycoside hydrolase family protein [Rickettsia endosymbiont of Degeeriella rufa]
MNLYNLLLIIAQQDLKQLVLDNKITEEDAEKLLDADIAEVNCVLYKYCHSSLNINQQVALIYFIFNCGSTAFKNSTLLEKLNQNKISRSC